MKDWAERMLRACMQFAQEENLRGVSVALAQSQFSFHHPYVHGGLSPDVRQREAERIRERMQMHHDFGLLSDTSQFIGMPQNDNVNIANRLIHTLRHASAAKGPGVDRPGSLIQLVVKRIRGPRNSYLTSRQDSSLAST